jgi:hypothetical protein
MSSEAFKSTYGNATGIVFQTLSGGGHHIDLWNKGQTGSGYWPASEIIFWPIK